MKGICYVAIGLAVVSGCSKGSDTTIGANPGSDAPKKSTPSVPATPAPSQGAGPYKFSFSPVGDNSYKTTTKFTTGQNKLKEATFTMTTSGTKNPDGTFTLQSDTSSVNGMPPVKRIQTADASGKVLKMMEDTGGGLHSIPVGTTIAATFPDHPVKIGEMWTRTQPEKEGTIVSTYKLVKVDGDLATLEETRESKSPKVSSKGTIVIEMSTGIPRSTILDMDSVAQPPKGSAQQVKMHMEMVKQ